MSRTPMSREKRLSRRGFVQRAAGLAGLPLGNSFSCAESPVAIPSASWWPEWRHDGHRSGCSQLAGAIQKPAERWSYFLGVPPTARVEDLTAPPAPATYVAGRHAA